MALTADARSVRGTLQTEHGRRQRFWGWLELMEALHRLAGLSRQIARAENTGPDSRTVAESQPRRSASATSGAPSGPARPRRGPVAPLPAAAPKGGHSQPTD